jgi:hypothetical protein
MHMHHGVPVAAITSLAATLWAAAIAVTAAAMLELPSSPVRSSLILADLWCLVGAMTTTISLVVLVGVERHRRAIFEYGYLSALADAKSHGPISINTRARPAHSDSAVRRSS